MDSSWPSRWRATTIRASSSPTRARRPASAASCATSSPWARGRSRAWTRCASARSTRRACAIWSTASCAASATTATASAFPRSAARPAFTRATTATSWSTRSRSAWRAPTASSWPRRAASGNPVFYVGSRTGRDGIHGATMASEAFDQESEAKRPTVQVGDPFTEKILLEACLEAMRTDAVVAIQDMGAAGLTSSSLEMAGRGGLGLRLDLDAVPLREPGLSAVRDHAVGVAGAHGGGGAPRAARKSCGACSSAGSSKWSRSASSPTTASPSCASAALPWAASRSSRSPRARRSTSVRSSRPPISRAASAIPRCRRSGDVGRALERLLGTPELGDKSWVWRQYDHSVRGNTVIGPGGDAALLRIKGTSRGLGLTCDVNPVYCWLDPRTGGAQAVAEAARNLACVGAEPVGLTDCLNFGSPENPAIAWQFRECIRGMAEASRALGVPVVSGNVSFYNETEGSAVHPTPSVAMVGVAETLVAHPVSFFRAAGDRVLLLGRDRRRARRLGLSAPSARHRAGAAAGGRPRGGSAARRPAAQARACRHPAHGARHLGGWAPGGARGGDVRARSRRQARPRGRGARRRSALALLGEPGARRDRGGAAGRRYRARVRPRRSACRRARSVSSPARPSRFGAQVWNALDVQHLKTAWREALPRALDG